MHLSLYALKFSQEANLFFNGRNKFAVKGQLISKGLFVCFHLHQKRTKIFFYFCPEGILFQNNTFVGSSPTHGNYFFLKSDLKWAFSDILIHIQCSKYLTNLKGQIEEKTYFLEWGSNSRI